MKILAISAALTVLSMPAGVLSQTNIFFPDDADVIDVTKPPYNAKGDGTTDDTAAINAALRDHNVATSVHHMMTWTIYFPEGTYLVSDTLVPKAEVSGDHPLSCVRLVGQGRDKTIIKLKDNAQGFDDPDDPKNVVRLGYFAEPVSDYAASGNQPNSAYNNYIQHLTVDVGSGNPGAGGIQFDVANVGAMQDVRIVSSDPDRAGAYGLGMLGTGGIGYVKRVEVVGFDHGLHIEDTVNNYVYEHIDLSEQRKAAIYNEGKVVSVRNLTSRNSVPVLSTLRPQAATFLIGGEVHGSGGPMTVMQTSSFLYLRDLEIRGYDMGVEVRDGSGEIALTPTAVDEWWSHEIAASEGAASLRLAVEETPEYDNPDLSQWANAEDFGATRDDDSDDDAPGIQAAVDSGYPIVYLPRGRYTLKTDVIVRGNVRKVDFFFSQVLPEKDSNAAIRVAQDQGQQVVLENWDRHLPLIHDSAGTVVVRNQVGRHWGPLTCGENASGDLFLENIGPHANISIGPGVHAWMRAINREKKPFVNDGGTVWFYGDNIESMGRRRGDRIMTHISPIRTINGGKTEYLAGCIDALTTMHFMKDGPLFLTVNSTLSANAAGESRSNDRGEGYWPWYFRSIQGEVEARVLDADVLMLQEGDSWPRRVVVPMYSTAPPPVQSDGGNAVTEYEAAEVGAE